MAGNGRLGIQGGDGARAYSPLADRLPPQNLEAETRALASLLNADVNADVVTYVATNLKKEHFYQDENGELFEAIKAIRERGDPLNMVSLAEELWRRGNFETVGGMDRLAEIGDAVPIALDGMYYANVVIEKHRHRQLIDIGTQVIREGYSNHFTADELLAMLQQQLSMVTPLPGQTGNALLPDRSINYSALTADEVNFRNATKVSMKATEWHWKYRIAAGEMTLIAGEGGLGKSQVTLWIAAATSRGWEWPDHSGHAPIGKTLIVTAEDDAEKTILPRLTAMGADLAQIEITTSPRVIIKDREKTLYVDMKQLCDRTYWERVFDIFPDTRLLIVDPVVSYLGRGVSDQKNDDVRSVIEPFIEELVRPRGISFIAITHLNKSLEAKSVKHRINASIAFVNIPRNVHGILMDSDNPDWRVFGQIKCNNAPGNLKSLKFSIETRQVQCADAALETSIPVFDAELHSLDLNRVMSGDNARGRSRSNR